MIPKNPSCCVLAIAALLAACGGADADDAGTDAGHDAGADGESDAGPPDADIDANCSGQDASVDARSGVSPGIDPGWTRLSGFPDDCYVERAMQPEGVLVFHWAACAGDLPGCEMTVLDWADGRLDGVGGDGAVDTLIWSLFGTDHSTAVVTHGATVIGAWRQPLVVGDTACTGAIATSNGGLALDAAYYHSSVATWSRVTVATWGDLTTLDGPVWMSTPTELSGGSFLEAPSASATAYAAMTPDGRIIMAVPPRGAQIGYGAYPIVVGSTVLWNWEDDTGASAIHASTIDGPENELYRAPAGTHVFWARSDGAWIAWRAGTDDPTGVTVPLNELWAAPYAATGPLVGRMLRNDIVNDDYAGTVGDGMFAATGPDPTGTHGAIVVTSLAEGSRRYYLLPSRDACSTGWWLDPADPAWVTRDEVAIPMHYINHVAGIEGFHAVIRVDIRDLPVEPMP